MLSPLPRWFSSGSSGSGGSSDLSWLWGGNGGSGVAMHGGGGGWGNQVQWGLTGGGRRGVAEHGEDIRPRPNAQNATAAYMANVGKRTNEWAPNFWNSLNSDQQNMYKGAWEKSGQSPSTVLASRARNSISQGFSRAG